MTTGMAEPSDRPLRAARRAGAKRHTAGGLSQAGALRRVRHKKPTPPAERQALLAALHPDALSLRSRREAQDRLLPFALSPAGKAVRHTVVVVDARRRYALVPLDDAGGLPAGLAGHDGVLLVNDAVHSSQGDALYSQILALKRAQRVPQSAAAAAQQGQPSRAGQAVAQLRERLGAAPADGPFLTPEQVRQSWVDAGWVVGSAALAHAWSRRRQALDQMADRGELLGFKHKGRAWYPAGFSALPAGDVALICQTLGTGRPGSDPVAQVMFLLQPQPADNNQTVLQLWSGNRDRAQQYLREFIRSHPPALQR